VKHEVNVFVFIQRLNGVEIALEGEPMTTHVGPDLVASIRTLIFDLIGERLLKTSTKLA
jgi:hypothetical protein